MIIYNVTIKTDPEITAEWLQWMQVEHLKEMMDTGLFKEYRMSRLLEQDEAGEGATFVIQYVCETYEHYQDYIDKHSKRMREKSFYKFGDKFVGFRTIMEVIT